LELPYAHPSDGGVVVYKPNEEEAAIGFDEKRREGVGKVRATSPHALE
jgi:hypothetical protein